MVQLFCHGNKEGAAGGSKRGFNNLFIALSNMDKKYASNALNTLIHELIH